MASKYHVVVQQPEPESWRWGWEIYRDGQPLPARLRSGGGRYVRNAAYAAGGEALRKFLADLDREQNA